MKTIDSLQLSPAESLFIITFENPYNGASAIERLSHSRAFREQLTELTFFDLLLRKVLKVDFRIETFGFIFKRTSKRTYIVRGEYFSHTSLKPHELPFKNCIEHTNSDLQLMSLAERLKNLFFELENPHSIEKLIRTALISGGYIEANKFMYSEKGLKAKNKIGKLLMDGETLLEYWIKNEPARAKAFFQVCGGNILLIKKFDLKKIAEWSEFLVTNNFQKNVSDYFDFYLADKIDFKYDFENISDLDIDNGFKAIYEDPPAVYEDPSAVYKDPSGVNGLINDPSGSKFIVLYLAVITIFFVLLFSIMGQYRGNQIWDFTKGRQSLGTETVTGLNETTKVIYEDERFVTFENGIVRDVKKGLEWVAGSDRSTNWYMAKSWVSNLNQNEFEGGNWRMPTITELKTIEGPAHSLLKTDRRWVWSGEKKDGSFMWFFLFDYNYTGFNSPNFRDHRLCAFAVRSLKR